MKQKWAYKNSAGSQMCKKNFKWFWFWLDERSNNQQKDGQIFWHHIATSLLAFLAGGLNLIGSFMKDLFSVWSCLLTLVVVLLELMRNWFVSPGWSTSWMAAANRADIISRGVKTDWKKENKNIKINTNNYIVGCWGLPKIGGLVPILWQ